MNKNKGMTLVEMMAVVAVVGVIFVVAQGPLASMIRGQRVQTVSNDVFTSLILARSEAVKRNSCVEVVPVNTANWALGWTVQVPTTGGVPACGGTGVTVVRTYAAVDQVSVTGPTASITFNGAGRLSALGDTSNASLCNNSCSSSCTINNAPPSFRLALNGTSTLRCVAVRSSGAPEVRKG